MEINILDIFDKKLLNLNIDNDKSISKLHISNCNQIKSINIRNLLSNGKLSIKNCKLLTNINLNNNNIKILNISQCPRIKSINLSYINLFILNDISFKLKCLDNTIIKQLILNNYNGKDIIINNNTNIKILKIINSQSLKTIIIDNQFINHLEIVNCSGLENIMIKNKTKKIKTLILKNNKELLGIINNDSVKNIMDNDFNYYFSNLLKLNINQCQKLLVVNCDIYKLVELILINTNVFIYDKILDGDNYQKRKLILNTSDSFSTLCIKKCNMINVVYLNGHCQRFILIDNLMIKYVFIKTIITKKIIINSNNDLSTIDLSSDIIISLSFMNLSKLYYINFHRTLYKNLYISNSNVSQILTYPIDLKYNDNEIICTINNCHNLHMITNFNEIHHNVILHNTPLILYSDKFNFKNDTLCAICLNNITIDNYIQTICNHYYHLKCLYEWYIRKPNCPTCRHDIMTYNNMMCFTCKSFIDKKDMIHLKCNHNHHLNCIEIDRNKLYHCCVQSILSD